MIGGVEIVEDQQERFARGPPAKQRRDRLKQRKAGALGVWFGRRWRHARAKRRDERPEHRSRIGERLNQRVERPSVEQGVQDLRASSRARPSNGRRRAAMGPPAMGEGTTSVQPTSTPTWPLPDGCTPVTRGPVSSPAPGRHWMTRVAQPNRRSRRVAVAALMLVQLAGQMITRFGRGGGRSTS